MLILASNTDKLQITTGNASAIDVHASWMDNVSGAVAPGRTNTLIAAAATTTVVGSPAPSVFRSVKTLHIFNRGNASNAITVIHTDGTTAVELHKVTLPANSSLQYIDEVGFATSIPGVAGMSQLISQKVITAPVKQVDFVSELSDVFIEYRLSILGLQVNDSCLACLRVSKNAGVTWEQDPAGQYFNAYLAIGPGSGLLFQDGGLFDAAWLGTNIDPTTTDPFSAGNIMVHTAMWSKSGVRKLFLVDGVQQDPGWGATRTTLSSTFIDDTHSNPPLNGLRVVLTPDGGPAQMIAGTFNLYGVRSS